MTGWVEEGLGVISHLHRVGRCARSTEGELAAADGAGDEADTCSLQGEITVQVLEHSTGRRLGMAAAWMSCCMDGRHCAGTGVAETACHMCDVAHVDAS